MYMPVTPNFVLLDSSFELSYIKLPTEHSLEIISITNSFSPFLPKHVLPVLQIQNSVKKTNNPPVEHSTIRLLLRIYFL